VIVDLFTKTTVNADALGKYALIYFVFQAATMWAFNSTSI